MPDLPIMDYSPLDKPEILHHIFYPRREWRRMETGSTRDISIPVEGDIAVGARFHLADKHGPTILFFHGNGEIAADYDDLAPVYNRLGINFLVVDYRGYGQSNGTPTVSAMMRDCLTAYNFARRWLADNGCTGPFLVMGRSLGSASALELAAIKQTDVDGLIVESGFAFSGPLLKLLGVSLEGLDFSESKGFRNLDKMREFKKPVLIIHSEFDTIIPFSDGQAFFDASPSRDKTLLKIQGAGHNDIFSVGLMEYMTAVKLFVERVRAASSGSPAGGSPE